MVEEKAQLEAKFLAEYDVTQYERPSVTVDILVFKFACRDGWGSKCSLQILLIKRKRPPFQDYWALPGGFVEMDESLRAAAKRELFEETGLQPDYFEQVHTYGAPGRDPRSRVISTAYLSIAERAAHVQAGDDAGEAVWFDLDCCQGKKENQKENGNYACQWDKHLTCKSGATILSALIKVKKTVVGNQVNISREIAGNSGLAFDHAQIIDDGLSMLRDKVEATDLLFKMLPQYFTLADLHNAFAVVTGQTLSEESVDLKWAKRILEAEQDAGQGEQLPERQYTYNPLWQEQ